MAKRKPETMEDHAVQDYKDRKKKIEREAEIAVELMDDKRFPILKEFLMRESRLAAQELSRVLKRGTKRVLKGEVWSEETLDATNQLIEAKCLAWKCNFLNLFAIDPENAILQKKEMDELEERMKDENK